MFSNKLLTSSRSVIGANVPAFRNTWGSVRRCHVAVTPPREKLSTGEFVFCGVFLAAAMFGYPAWVLYSIPDYQKEDRNTYTGK